MGIEIGTTDIDAWVDEFLEHQELQEIREALEQLEFDARMDKEFETETCWQEYDEGVFSEWEALYLRTKLCLQIRSDLSMAEPLARPGILWSLHTGGAEIDEWFNDYRTTQEVEEWEDRRCQLKS
jgi:hypothetical protein